MRIALITPEYPGYGPSFGIGRYVADLAQALRAGGHTVVILAATDAGGVVIGADRPVQPLPHSLFRRALVVRAWLLRELEAFHPDVVEAPNWGALTAFLSPRWPVVIRLSTSAADAGGSRSDPLRSFRVLLERRAVQQANVVVADSRAMAVRAASLYDRPSDLVIPHAWHGPVVAEIGERPPAVLFVGRWEPRKGVDVLLAAWPRVLAAFPDAHLHLVGGGQPSGLGGPGITAHGRLDDAALAALRSRCRIQVVPSRFESFGLVVLEAWAAGLVVVACPGGALADLVAGVGILVPPSSEGIAEGLHQALVDPGTWATSGRKRLEHDHGPRAWIAATLAAYARARGEPS